jgi:hypothetical protein
MHRWEFDEDGNAILATPEELGSDTITIRQESGDNEEAEITHKNQDCIIAHRTLMGVMINLAGTQTAEGERLLE